MKKSYFYVFLGVLITLLVVGAGCVKKEAKETQTEKPAVEAAKETAKETSNAPKEETAQPSLNAAAKEPEAQTADKASAPVPAQETKQAEILDITAGSAPEGNQTPGVTASEPAAKEEPQTAKEKEESKSPFEEYLAGLPGRFLPEKAEGVSAVYQFNITDGHTGKYFVKIAGGSCSVGKGTVNSPNITVNVGEQLWLDIARDKENGTMAYLSGKFTASGDTDYLTNMKKYFKKLG